MSNLECESVILCSDKYCKTGNQSDMKFRMIVWQIHLYHYSNPPPPQTNDIAWEGIAVSISPLLLFVQLLTKCWSFRFRQIMKILSLLKMKKRGQNLLFSGGGGAVMRKGETLHFSCPLTSTHLWIEGRVAKVPWLEDWKKAVYTLTSL